MRTRVRDALVRRIEGRPGLLNELLRRNGSPRLYDLFEAASPWCNTPDDLVAAVCGLEAVPWIDEARTVVATILARDPVRRYPSTFTVEGGTALCLYAIVRACRPAMVVETGVADGLSTAVVLEGLRRNDCGELHSYDRAADVGAYVTDAERWTLHLDPLALAPLSVDLFFHDSDHAYQHQHEEYAQALAAVRPGGLLMSDDVDWSYAFLELARGRDVPMLIDGRKVFGVLSVDAATPPESHLT